MNEKDCLEKMVAPGERRPGKWRDGCVQILVTHSCDKSCFGCTQGSNLVGPKWFMTPDQFRLACRSLKGYFGVVGMFGGNPALHPQFAELCAIMRDEIPEQQRGIWCNHPIKLDNAKLMRHTFNPQHSNLNVHLDAAAFQMFKEGWPECHPFGLGGDSRHSPPWVAMKDLDTLPVFDKKHRLIAKMDNNEENRLSLIADCDINQHWSAGIGVFRGELRAWFCEIAMAQAIRHQDEPDYPDTGFDPAMKYEVHTRPGGRLEKTVCEWWQLTMPYFVGQVRKHCHECSVPLRGYGELAMSSSGEEQTSMTHSRIFKPKRAGRAVELINTLDQLDCGKIDHSNHYIQNASK